MDVDPPQIEVKTDRHAEPDAHVLTIQESITQELHRDLAFCVVSMSVFMSGTISSRQCFV